MIRYAIDALPASGSAAVFLLGIVAIARGVHKSNLGASASLHLQEMIEELQNYVESREPTQLDELHSTEIRRRPNFHDYFGMQTSNRALIHFKSKETNAACAYLRNFLLEEITKIDSAESMFRLDKMHSKPFVPLLKTAPYYMIASKILQPEALRSPHPQYTWKSWRGRTQGYEVPAFSGHSIKLALSGLSLNYRHSAPQVGVFLVIREARGLYGSDLNRLTVLARDLLWIRRTDNAEHDDLGLAKGYYFSVMDDGIFEVRSIDLNDDGQTTMSGRRLRKGHPGTRDDPHHFYLSVPQSSETFDGMQARLGLLCGTTSEASRAAAWKVLVVERPAENQALERALETIVGQQGIVCTRGKLERREDATSLGKLGAALDYLQTNDVVGILASLGGAVNRSGKTAHEFEALTASRVAFKSLAAHSKPPTANRYTRELFLRLLDQKFVRQHRDERLFIGIIDAILQRWHLIEPVHMFLEPAIAPRSDYDTSAIQADLHRLATSKPIERAIGVGTAVHK